MIKVLQNWEEIKEAGEFLSSNVLPKHGHSPEKNWDLYQLHSVVESMPKEAEIIDLGCGDLFALKLLHALGFKNLYGIDLCVSPRNRLRQGFIMLKERSLRLPFHLCKGDLTKTRFPSGMFGLAVCISVIEHGVNIERLFAETHRLLKPGGILFITTDYWEEEIMVAQDNKPFGQSWRIFSKKDAENIINTAYKYGFSLFENSFVPACQAKCIVWNEQEYTFLAIVFKKTS